MIMPPRMRTRSVGRPAVESVRGGTSVRVGRGGRGRRPKEGNDERVDDLNGQGNNQCVRANRGVEGVNGGALDFSTIIAQQLQNLLPHMLAQVYVTEEMLEIRMFCPSHEMQKLESELWNHAMVGAGHAAYTDRVHELARLVPHLVTPESRMIERFEKRGNIGEPSKDKNGRDDNKRARTGNDFATIVNPVRRENMGTSPKCTTCNYYHTPGGACRICFNCNCLGQLARDCRSVSRNVILSMLETQLLGHVMSAIVPTMSGQLALGGIELKDREKIAQIKFLLITGVRVVKTNGTRLGVGYSCWEQRKLARI
ncbi:hypothetical protein Tco_0881160 [Tanacetum coccineum]